MFTAIERIFVGDESHNGNLLVGEIVSSEINNLCHSSVRVSLSIKCIFKPPHWHTAQAWRSRSRSFISKTRTHARTHITTWQWVSHNVPTTFARPPVVHTCTQSTWCIVQYNSRSKVQPKQHFARCDWPVKKFNIHKKAWLASNSVHVRESSKQMLHNVAHARGFCTIHSVGLRLFKQHWQLLPIEGVSGQSSLTFSQSCVVDRSLTRRFHCKGSSIKPILKSQIHENGCWLKKDYWGQKLGDKIVQKRKFPCVCVLLLLLLFFFLCYENCVHQYIRASEKTCGRPKILVDSSGGRVKKKVKGNPWVS